MRVLLAARAATIGKSFCRSGSALFSTDFVATSSKQSKNSAAVKSPLAILRKRTGYTFANCKKAIEKFGAADVDGAERWLREQAQSEGWAAAERVQHRATREGLLGLHSDRQLGVLVEVSCETDFVARNQKFHEFVARAAEHCVAAARQQSSDDIFQLGSLDASQLAALRDGDRTLADLLALYIGQLGENMQLQRAVFLRSNAPEAVRISGYVHAASKVFQPISGIAFGRYGALVAWRSESDDEHLDSFGRQLCQHIVGMKPESIGSYGSEDDGGEVIEYAENPEEDSRLLQQEFLADSVYTVAEILHEKRARVLDFIRFECGELTASQAADSHSSGSFTSAAAK